MAVSFKPALAGFICSVLYETYPSEEVSHLWTQPLVRRGEKTGSLKANGPERESIPGRVEKKPCPRYGSTCSVTVQVGLSTTAPRL